MCWERDGKLGIEASQDVDGCFCKEIKTSRTVVMRHAVIRRVTQAHAPISFCGSTPSVGFALPRQQCSLARRSEHVFHTSNNLPPLAAAALRRMR